MDFFKNFQGGLFIGIYYICKMLVKNLENRGDNFINTDVLSNHIYQQILSFKDVSKVLSIEYNQHRSSWYIPSKRIIVDANVISKKGYPINRQYTIKIDKQRIRESQLNYILN